MMQRERGRGRRERRERRPRYEEKVPMIKHTEAGRWIQHLPILEFYVVLSPSPVYVILDAPVYNG